MPDTTITAEPETAIKSFHGWQPINTAPYSEWIVVSNGKRTAYMVMDDYDERGKCIWMESTPDGMWGTPSLKPKYWFNERHELPSLRSQIGTGPLPDGFENWDEWEKANNIASPPARRV